MDFSEVFSQVWTYIAGGVAGIGGGAIISWLFSLILAHSNKKHTKALLDAIETFRSAQFDKSIEQIKSINLTQNIQPIVQSEIVKAYETAFEGLHNELELTRKRYADLVNCFEKLSEYFEYSYGVSDETKQELKNAIEQAKSEAVDNEPVKMEVVVEEPKEEPVVVKKSVKTTNVVR